MPAIAVNQGVLAEFRVLQNYGINAVEGEVYVCSSIASRGFFVAVASAGICAAVSGDMAAGSIYLGFVEQDVVADNSQPIDFGYKAQQQGATVGGAVVSGDLVAIWRAGRFFVTAVSGTVANLALIYPQDGGKLGSIQIGSAPAVGYAVKGNNSVAGDPIEVEIFLVGRRSLTT